MADERPRTRGSVYQRLVRHVHDVADILIENAQSGRHPEAAIILVKYFIVQADRGAPVDPRVNTYIAAALAEAIRRLPAGGREAAVDAFILLGLVRREGGRPKGSGGKFTEGLREEMARVIAERLAAGVSYARIKEEVANSFDCSEDHVQGRLREMVRRSSDAVKRTGERARQEECQREDEALVGGWLDDVDRYALELGVPRHVVELIAVRSLKT